VMDYSQFMEEVKAGRIAEGDDRSRDLKAKDHRTGSPSTATLRDIWLVSDLAQVRGQDKAKREEEPSLLMNIFVSWSRCCS